MYMVECSGCGQDQRWKGRGRCFRCGRPLDGSLAEDRKPGGPTAGRDPGDEDDSKGGDDGK